MFQNVRSAHEEYGTELVWLVDGTYKLHDGGYVLLVAGTIHLYYSQEHKEIRHAFRPFAYAIVPSESPEVRSAAWSLISRDIT